LISCDASIKLTVKLDGSAGFSVDSAIPLAVANRMASFRDSSEAAAAPIFNPGLVRQEAGMRGIAVISAAAPTRETFSGSFAVRTLGDLDGKSASLAGSGLLTSRHDPSGGSIAFSLTRANAKYLPELFPGIDPYILEALSPPAIEDAPITKAEYRSMLESLFGSLAMPSIDNSAIKVSITVPGTILSSSGGTVAGFMFQTRIPVVEALVLEKPIEFFVAWKH
jgi:hypothetical protein